VPEKKNTADLIQAQLVAAREVNTSEPLVAFQPWCPTMDNDEIPSSFMKAIETGKIHKMPIILATTGHEATIFIYRGFREYVNDVTYIGIVSTIFKLSHAPRVLFEYPPFPRFGDKRPALCLLANDYIFFAVTRHISNLLNKQGINNYWYHFTKNSNKLWEHDQDYHICLNQSCHGQNVPFVFNSHPEFDAREKEISNTLIDYYSNFARSGNPNRGNRNITLSWPQFVESSKIHMEIGEKIELRSNFRNENFNFWDRMGYIHGSGDSHNK